MDTQRIVDCLLSDVSLLSCDRVNSVKGSHGSLSIAILNAANRIVESLLAGTDARINNTNAPDIPLDGIIKKGVAAAKEFGATPSNAALITATLLYFTGTGSRAGVPASNRKLGAMARMHAGAERSGVAMIPTAKQGNKVSGFPAVRALYDAIDKKKLTRVHGGFLPFGGSYGTPYGHSALGEDIVIPEIAINGARIATRAMKKAYEGIGTQHSPILCAIFGVAAVTEILHCDACVAEKYGPYGKIDSVYLAGKAAIEEVGLIKELHLIGTGSTIDTARMVADLGLILKDVGAPTVVGMLAFNDLLSGFEESNLIMSNPIRDLNPPMGHVPTLILIPVIDELLKNGGDIERTAELIRSIKKRSIDVETSHVCSYIMSRTAGEVTAGPVTGALLSASKDIVHEAITKRVETSRDLIAKGKGVGEIARMFDDERKAVVEKNAAAYITAIMKKKYTINITRIEPQARRTDPTTKKYFGFDANFDVEVTADRWKRKFINLYGKVLPRYARGGVHRVLLRTVAAGALVLFKMGLLKYIIPGVKPGMEWILPSAINWHLVGALVATQELTYGANSLLNVVVPVAVAVSAGVNTPDEAARIAERATVITASIPGTVVRAREVGEKIKSLIDGDRA